MVINTIILGGKDSGSLDGSPHSCSRWGGGSADFGFEAAGVEGEEGLHGSEHLGVHGVWYASWLLVCPLYNGLYKHLPSGLLMIGLGSGLLLMQCSLGLNPGRLPLFCDSVSSPAPCCILS